MIKRVELQCGPMLLDSKCILCAPVVNTFCIYASNLTNECSEKKTISFLSTWLRGNHAVLTFVV